MGKTIQVAAERAYDQTKTVLPAEYARGLHIKNAPSLKALKLMHLMIATAGGRLADDVRHDLLLSEINSIEGMTHHGKESLKLLSEELRAAVLTYEDLEAMRYTIGGFLDHAVVDFHHEASGAVLMSWYFGRMFREMAAASDHWAVLDRQTIFHLGSRYSVLLFQHVSSLVGMKHVQSKTFSIAEIRGVLGIEGGKLTRVAHVNDRAIKPAVAEINALSRYNLTATPKKIGRTIVAFEIGWALKPDLKPAKKTLQSPLKGVKPSVGVTPRISAKAFPATGTIEFSKPWNEIAKLNGNGKDKDLIAQDFRNWCATSCIPLDGPAIEKIFTGFCKRATL